MILVKILGFIIMIPCLLVGVIAGLIAPFAILGSIFGDFSVGTTIAIVVVAVISNPLGVLGLWMTGIIRDDEEPGYEG